MDPCIVVQLSINNQQDATWQRNLLFHLFIKSSTCFEHYVAHHQELQLYLQPLVYIRVWWPAVVKSEWELHVELLMNKWNNKFHYQVASCWLFILSFKPFFYAYSISEHGEQNIVNLEMAYFVCNINLQSTSYLGLSRKFVSCISFLIFLPHCNAFPQL